MVVTACLSVHVPVSEVLDATGAKHDCRFWSGTADANAPDDSSWRMCRPGPAPCHSDNVNWKPVMYMSDLKRKSWYRMVGSVRRGQLSEHVLF